MSRTAVGTLAWARRTDGYLSRMDQLTLLVDAVRVEIRERLHRRRIRVPVDLAVLRLPDSALSRKAYDLVDSVSDPWLVQHCVRTYLWGAVLASIEGRRFDEELLYVAALFHDLGLTTGGVALNPHPAKCFAVDGAFAAEEFLRNQQVPDARRERIAEAVSLHLNVRVPLRHGVEAYLLHEGAGLDVVALRFREIHKETRDEVLRRHPRLGMKAALVPLLAEQARIRPRSRMGFLCMLPFLKRIERAPFES